MKILFLNSLSKSKWGGGEKWMISAGKGLGARGHSVTIACTSRSKIKQKAEEAGLQTWEFSIPADIAFWKGRTLRAFLKAHHIDVLVCCQNKDVKVGARTAKKAGIKAIFARQGVQNLSNKKKYIKPFTQYIDGIITNTKSIKDVYESFGWFPEDFIHVVYNGVTIPGNIQPIDIHNKFGLSDTSSVIFSAGRLDYQKGFDLLISVAAKARDQKLDWQFIIAGEGKLKNELLQSAESAGVGGTVHFIGFSDQVPALLTSSDIFVLPSRYEGMPNALLEAMACGKACVATRVNGASELVEEGISGFLVDPEHPQQLFERIKTILSDNQLKKELGKNARDRVRSKFTIDRMIDQLEELFQRQLQKDVEF